MKNKSNVSKILLYIVLCIGALCIFIPLYITLITAFKTTEDSAKNFFGLPTSFYLGNFTEVMSDEGFITFVTNSLVITCVSLVVIVLIVPMVSYAISKNMNHWFYKATYMILIAGIFVPFQMLIVPLTRLLSKMHLMNQWGLILCYIAFSLTQGVFLFVGFLKSVPGELQQASKIDGCNEFQTLYLIIFPIAKPMVATIAILNVLWIWNDFLLPLVVLNRSQAYWTLPLFQYNFKTTYSFNYNLACASFLFSIIPVTILYLFLQKYIIKGLTAGAVKA